jgi:hypothetical protein
MTQPHFRSAPAKNRSIVVMPVFRPFHHRPSAGQELPGKPREGESRDE